MSVLVDDRSADYPATLIADCESAALLYCNGRMGAGDGYWFKDSGLTDVACVAWDDATLGPYRSIYPAAWSYVQADAATWAQAQDRTWDIVSVDVPADAAGDMFPLLPLWTAIAGKYVVATVQGLNPQGDPGAAMPDGWQLTDSIKRAEYDDGRVFHWLVLSVA